MRRFLLLLLLASASAFVLPLAARPRVGFTRVRMGVEQAAKNCLEEGCPIDLVEELVGVMKIHEGDSVIIDQLVTLLKDAEANKSEIEKLVGAAFRLFSKADDFDFKGEPLGYSTKPTKGNKID